MDESEPGPSNNVEKTETPVEKPPEPEKKHRRRSSIGGDILSAFMNAQSEDTMSPLEKPSRPRRAAHFRPAPVFQAASVVVRKKPVRYSFDLGERVATKSCLKPSTAPILVRKTPSSKSSTQRAAQKIISKYRKSRSMSRTPHRERESKLRFDQICTIRIITPRPEYDPDHPEMPHSDEEEDKSINPHRERLSTVQLRLTPTSEAQLHDMQDKEIVQFRAEMVFGDNDVITPKVTSSEATADAPESLNAGDGPEPPKPPEAAKLTETTFAVKKKSSRRKSLVIGGASPLKLQSIERPRFEEDIEDEISEPKRKSRRSLRINPAESGKSEEEEESVKLLEENVNIDSAPSSESEKTSKKRELHLEVPTVSTEPQPKRNRRKSMAPMAQPSSSSSSLEADDERRVRRKSRIVKKEDLLLEEKKEPTEKSTETSKPADFFAPKAKKLTANDRKRRSARFVVTEVPTETEVVEVQAPIIIEEAQKPTEEPSTPKLTKLAPMFLKTPTPVAKKIEKSATVPDLKAEETKPSTSNSSPAPKMFSLFSKPKSVKPAGSVDSPAPVVDLTANSPSSVPSASSSSSSASRISGIRREATWGDSHPETYQFIQNTPRNASIFPESDDSCGGLKWKSAEDMKISCDAEHHLQMRTEQSKLPTSVVTSSDPTSPLEKFEISGCDPMSVCPSAMDQLVEGADEEQTVRGWLRRWKRRVRKEAEKDMSKEKKKEKKKKRRKEEDSDDEDYEAEDDGGDLENPLVLIGPTGVGKSALIRALAKQENMRCLSTGPEALRTGKEMKERLQEAMRTHRVDQQANRRMTFFYGSGNKVYTQKEKSPTVTDEQYTQTLIVIEHVDVFFESIDRNGVGGLLEMVNEAKVPIVFTCEKEWPKRWGQIELERRPLEIWMGRNGKKAQEYVQKMIYSTRGVHIDSPTISSISESVDHDLRALIRQAHFYSLAPDLPLPLTSRNTISDGFSSSWDAFDVRKTELKMERMENLAVQYADVLEQLATPDLPDLPQIERFWDAETRGFAERKAGYAGNVQMAHDALNGRYSRRAVAMDVLPLLAPMDRVERRKMSRSRRHLHRFRHESDVPTDGDALIVAVAKWNIL